MKDLQKQWEADRNTATEQLANQQTQLDANKEAVSEQLQKQQSQLDLGERKVEKLQQEFADAAAADETAKQVQPTGSAYVNRLIAEAHALFTTNLLTAYVAF